MLSPLETEDGLFGLSVIRDISERKRAEEAHRRDHDQLELRVEERTAQLLKANEELRLAATVMQDSNDACRSCPKCPLKPTWLWPKFLLNKVNHEDAKTQRNARKLTTPL